MITCKSPVAVMRAAYELGAALFAEHSHAFSRKDFTLPQLFACLVLREHQKKSYRGTEALLRDCSDLREAVGLTRAPDHNTICRAFTHLVTPARMNRALDLQAAAAVPAAPTVVGPVTTGPGQKEVVLDWAPVAGTTSYVVEVDTDTGKVTLSRMITVDDAGRLLNPLLVEGQRHGGIAQGVAQALLEEVVYDADGNPLTSNLADYTFISACEVPSFELVAMETPTPVNPMGAKGIGESGTIGSTPAVQSAVIDALSHLGVRHIDMPATSERVWRAMSAAGEESAA